MFWGVTRAYQRGSEADPGHPCCTSVFSSQESDVTAGPPAPQMGSVVEGVNAFL